MQYIAGYWEKGEDDSENVDTNPFNGETLVKIPQATKAQLDSAYQVAKQAQIDWAQKTPSERAQVLYKVVEIFDSRKDEIIDWLVKESGSTTVKLEGDINGQLVSPYIFTNVTRDMDLAKNEIFGPLVGIIRAKDEIDALEIANDTRFGLSSAVFTNDLQKGLRFARVLKLE